MQRELKGKQDRGREGRKKGKSGIGEK